MRRWREAVLQSGDDGHGLDDDKRVSLADAQGQRICSCSGRLEAARTCSRAQHGESGAGVGDLGCGGEGEGRIAGKIAWWDARGNFERRVDWDQGLAG